MTFLSTVQNRPSAGAEKRRAVSLPDYRVCREI